MQHSLQKQPRGSRRKLAEMGAADHLATRDIPKSVQKPCINETELADRGSHRDSHQVWKPSNQVKYFTTW